MCKKRLNDNKLIQRVLSFEKEWIFEMDEENTYIDFMDYLDDESDENYDATPQTIMLESIRDDIFVRPIRRESDIENYFRENKTRPYSHNRP